EGDLIEAVQQARGRAAAIVVNAGALTHTSWALHDALAAFDGVIIELHLSNPAAREPFRHTSVVAPVADGSIAGFGALGYPLAIEAVHRLLTARTGGSV
ncbi:MAG: type II 3-dehydroquinate dehydratase, partial [Acidimicrobiales bacterium]